MRALRNRPCAKPERLAEIRMNRAELELALDEWMRKFIETPQAFDEQLHRVTQALKDQGEEPSYGLAGVAFLEMCLQDAKRRMT
jgi:hypothetical protein